MKWFRRKKRVKVDIEENQIKKFFLVTQFNGGGKKKSEFGNEGEWWRDKYKKEIRWIEERICNG